MRQIMAQKSTKSQLAGGIIKQEGRPRKHPEKLNTVILTSQSWRFSHSKRYMYST